MPYKGRQFNPQTLGKCFYFVICMITSLVSDKITSTYSIICLLRILRTPDSCLIRPKFGGKNVFLCAIYSTKKENIYKTLPIPPPVFQNTT